MDPVQLLLEKQAITDLMVEYADRIDANDPVGSAACFAEDGIGVYWGDYVGREAIAERLRGILAGFLATSHHLSNIAIEVDGEAATAQSYVYAFHRIRPGGEPMHYWGRWVDQLKKVDGRWYFARREVVGIGSLNPGNPPFDLRHPGHPGRVTHAEE